MPERLETLKFSSLPLVWLESDRIDDQSRSLAEIQISTREDFSGIGAGRHWEDLIEHLDHILMH